MYVLALIFSISLSLVAALTLVALSIHLVAENTARTCKKVQLQGHARTRKDMQEHAKTCKNTPPDLQNIHPLDGIELLQMNVRVDVFLRGQNI